MEPLFLPYTPWLEPIETFPVKPPTLFFFRRILIIPLPAASYLAEGLSISSILSSNPPGNDFKYAAKSGPDIYVARPSISTRMPLRPLRLISPLLPMVTPGVFSNTSSVLLVALLIMDSTFTMVLSMSCSINGRLALTITSFSSMFLAGNKMIMGNTRLLRVSSIVSATLIKGFCPMAVMANRYVPFWRLLN